MEKTSLDFATLKKLKHDVANLLAPTVTTGNCFYENSKDMGAILHTGSANLDKLLSGGLYTGEVTEVVGKCGSGKTQICMSAAVHLAAMNSISDRVSILSDIGENIKDGYTVAYIDTCNAFSALRISQIYTHTKLLSESDAEDTEVCVSLDLSVDLIIFVGTMCSS